MSKLCILIIDFYQKFLSPDHSFWAKERFPYGYCRFYPSCSEYLKVAIQKRGLGRGLILGCWRLLRCNPFSRGGIQEVK